MRINNDKEPTSTPSGSRKEVTAMAILRQKLQIVVDKLHDTEITPKSEGYCDALENVIKDIDAQMMDKEREQIVEAVEYGFRDAQSVNPDKTFEEYYNNTYGK